MGLRTAARRWALTTFFSGLAGDLETGEYGPEGVKAMDFIKANKGPIGIGVTFVAAGLAAIGYPDAATILASVGTALLGAGYVKSDADVKKGGAK